MEKYTINELEGYAYRAAIEETMEYCEIEDKDEAYDWAMERGFWYTEDGEMLHYVNGEYVTSYEMVEAKC